MKILVANTLTAFDSVHSAITSNPNLAPEGGVWFGKFKAATGPIEIDRDGLHALRAELIEATQAAERANDKGAVGAFTMANKAVSLWFKALHRDDAADTFNEQRNTPAT